MAFKTMQYARVVVVGVVVVVTVVTGSNTNTQATFKTPQLAPHR